LENNYQKANLGKYALQIVSLLLGIADLCSLSLVCLLGGLFTVSWFATVNKKACFKA